MKALILLSTLFLIFSCSKKVVEPQFFHGKTMGTTYSVKYYGELKADSLKVEADKLLVHVNQLMSTYIPSSEISTFNSSNSLEWTKIHSDFFTVLEHSLDIAGKTNGVYDPTIGPLVNLWGFGPTGKREVPKKSALEEAKNYVGYELVQIDDSKKSIKKLHPKVYLDLSASAKGYGVDALALLLEGKGVENYMVEIGGEVKTKGKTKGRDWRIAIEAPHPELTGELYQKVLNISGHAVATSGNYRNFFESNGKKYSHTINFKTGAPVAHTLASVTVVDKNSCMNADALATAFMALGVGKGYALAEKLGVAAYFIYRLDGQDAASFVEKGTTQFNRMFK